MKNNNQENKFGRRDFFRKTIQKTIPVLATLSLPSVMFGCGGDDAEDDDWQDGTGGSGGQGGGSGSQGGGSGSQGGNSGSSGISNADGTISGYGYVDLGLSVKWATCNLGCSSPEETGSCMEVIQYITMDSEQERIGRDLKAKGAGKNVNISGNSTYDRARNLMGSQWRMPTVAQYRELTSKCNAQAIRLNGQNGIKFTSKVNGKSIFFPIGAFKVKDIETDNFVTKAKESLYISGTLYNFYFSYSDGLVANFYHLKVNADGATVKDGFQATDLKGYIRAVSTGTGSGTTTGCNGNCTANCANNSTSSGCSGCSSSCSSGCKQNCDYNCAATCKSHCYGQCSDTCGGSCRYVSSGSSCSGCATSCYNRCYHTCSYACSSNCESSCVHGSK